MAAALLVWFAPEEQTIGRGIKTVYLHVGLTWAGMAGFALAGLLGLGVVLLAHEKLQVWMETIGRVGLGLYAAGVGMSIVASKVNWGYVFWREPRMTAALNMLAVAILVQIVIGWSPWVRLRGGLSVFLVALMAWSTWGAPLVLHPRSPILTSPSLAIQLSFVGLFLLFCLVAAWIVWYWRRTRTDKFTEQ